MDTTKNNMTANMTKMANVIDTVRKYDDGWSDTRNTCIYKGVEMTTKSYDIKMLLEKRAKAALIECRQTCKALHGKANCNDDFVKMFANGNINESSYKNSLTCKTVDKNTSVLYQQGLHFILAAKIGKDIFLNSFPFGNRTVTERERFTKLNIKTIDFKDGTIKNNTLEKLLFNCKTKSDAEKASSLYKFPAPDISKGIKNYLARCIAENNK